MLRRNPALEKAVKEEDLCKVKRLLELGVKGRCVDRALYQTRNVEIANYLLRYGARVNMKSTEHYNETPLQYAIKERKGFKMVRLLLNHGANVNAVDCFGHTSVVIALKNLLRTSADTDTYIVKELVFHGATITIRRLGHLFENVQNTDSKTMDCLKLMVKMSLLYIRRRTYFLDEVADWLRWYHEKTLQSLSNFYKDCVKEIGFMTSVYFTDGTSLCHYLLAKKTDLKMLYKSSKISNIRLEQSYPVYKDLILDKVNLQIELLNKLNRLEVYTYKVDGCQVHLNQACTLTIVKYLRNNDLFNFLTAFYKDDNGKHFEFFNNLLNTLSVPRNIH